MTGVYTMLLLQINDRSCFGVAESLSDSFKDSLKNQYAQKRVFVDFASSERSALIHPVSARIEEVSPGREDSQVNPIRLTFIPSDRLKSGISGLL